MYKFFKKNRPSGVPAPASANIPEPARDERISVCFIVPRAFGDARSVPMPRSQALQLYYLFLDSRVKEISIVDSISHGLLKGRVIKIDDDARTAVLKHIKSLGYKSPYAVPAYKMDELFGNRQLPLNAFFPFSPEHADIMQTVAKADAYIAAPDRILASFIKFPGEDGPHRILDPEKFILSKGNRAFVDNKSNFDSVCSAFKQQELQKGHHTIGTFFPRHAVLRKAMETHPRSSHGFSQWNSTFGAHLYEEINELLASTFQHDRKLVLKDPYAAVGKGIFFLESETGKDGKNHLVKMIYPDTNEFAKIDAGDVPYEESGYVLAGSAAAKKNTSGKLKAVDEKEFKQYVSQSFGLSIKGSPLLVEWLDRSRGDIRVVGLNGKIIGCYRRELHGMTNHKGNGAEGNVHTLNEAEKRHVEGLLQWMQKEHGVSYTGLDLMYRFQPLGHGANAPVAADNIAATGEVANWGYETDYPVEKNYKGGLLSEIQTEFGGFDTVNDVVAKHIANTSGDISSIKTIGQQFVDQFIAHAKQIKQPHLAKPAPSIRA